MSTWLYREHRGGLKESMATLKKFDCFEDMIRYICDKEKCAICDVSISLYDPCVDFRIKWNYTCLVSIFNCAFGFCTDSFF